MRTVARASLLLVAFVFAWANFSGPGPVSAQTPPPDTSVAGDSAAGGDQAAVNQQDEADQTNQPPIGNTSDATAVVLDSTMAFVIVLALLLLALIVLVALFRYLRESRQDYYGTIDPRIREKGRLLQPRSGQRDCSDRGVGNNRRWNGYVRGGGTRVDCSRSGSQLHGTPKQRRR